MTDTAPEEWVARVLRARPAPAMPGEVVEQLEDAIASEVRRRHDGALAEEAKRGVDEVARRSSQGSFGENAPAHFDKPGLGLIAQPSLTQEC